MKTALKKAGLPALVLLAAVMLLVFGTLVGCPQEEEEEAAADVPVETGTLTLSGLAENQTYAVSVYASLGVTLTTADEFAVATDKAKRVGYAGVAAKDTEASAVLKNMVNGSPKTTRFAESGEFLVTVTVKNAVKYNLVTFVDGNASLDVAMMIDAPAADPGKDEPGGEEPGGEDPKDEPVVYTLSFDLNYTGAPNPPAKQEIAEGKYAEQPADPARTGYTFGGWFLDAVGITTRWDFDINTVNGKTILYAKWTRNQYTVTFNTGGVGPTPEPLENVLYDGTIKAPETTKAGHTLDGWYTENTKTTKWDFGTDTVTESITLYGEWKRNPYKVTFNTGGVLPTPAPLENVWYDDTITDPGVTKTGYTFDGWYKENTKTTKWDFGTDTVKEDITLYGTWTQIRCTVKFFVGGVVHKAVDVAHGDKATPPTDIAPKANNDLDGWYTAADYAAKWDFNSTVTAGLDLYARWKPLTLAAVITDMAADKDKPTAAYTLPSGNETHTGAVTLTTANSPADVTIDGGGRVVTGSANLITIGSGVTLTLKNITFKTLPFTVSAGGKLVLDTGAVVRENAGAGVTVSGTSATAKGTLEMKAGSSVTQNLASGVTVQANGVFTMSGGTVSGNSNTGSGGGVALTGTGGSFTMSGGEISGNTVFIAAANGSGGGGVALTGTNNVFTMSSGTISGNSNTSDGGGVLITGTGGSFTMNGGTISGNSAGYGGGVVVVGAGNSFTMTNGTISGGNNAGFGGGVFLDDRSVFNMSGGEISGNNAANAGGICLWQDSNAIFNMSNGVIKNNIATNDGGGVYALATSTFDMTGGEITGNTAGYCGSGLFLFGNLYGNPSIGSKVNGKGSIYSNTPDNIFPAR
jgi:uncharacterized repeat protein (TIGR02543 family)